MTTKAAARRAILAGSGRGNVATTTADGNIGGTTFVCTDFKSAGLLGTDSLAGMYVHFPTATAPKQSRVAATGVTIASGTVLLDVALGSQILAGTVFEWSPTPIISGAATGDGPSFEGDLDEALRHLVFEDQVAQAITTASVISLATWANWLERYERINWNAPGGAFLEPAWVSGGELVDASYRGIKFELDGETPQIRLAIPYGAASGNLTIKVLRPADTWLKTGGGVTWSEVAPGTGLTVEADECKPDLRHLHEAGLVFYYQAQAARTAGPRRAEYQAKYEQQLAIARALPMWDWSRDTLLPKPEDQRVQGKEAAA